MNTRVLIFSAFAALLLHAPLQANTYNMPGFRKKAVVNDDFPNPFQQTTSKSQLNLDDRGEVIPEPDGLRSLEEYLKKNPVSAMAWNNNPAGRSVVIGDIILRQGAAFPSYVVEHGDNFVLTEITRELAVFVSTKNPAYRISAPINLDEQLVTKQHAKRDN